MKKRMNLLLVLVLLALPVCVRADTLTATVSTAIQATFVKAGDLSNPKNSLSKAIQKEFTNGTGNNQANLEFQDQRTLGDGANESLDLAGVLTDPFGATLTFAKVKALLIENLSTTQTLTVGAGGVNSFINWVGDASDTIKIPPGGFHVQCAPLAGFAVTADTGDLLKVTNSAGATCTYNIVIIGTSS